MQNHNAGGKSLTGPAPTRSVTAPLAWREAAPVGGPQRGPWRFTILPTRGPFSLMVGLWTLAAIAGVVVGVWEASSGARRGHSAGFKESGWEESSAFSPSSGNSAMRLKSGSEGVEVSPFQVRKDALLRLLDGAAPSGVLATHEQLVILRAIAGFSFEEAAEVLEHLLKRQESGNRGLLFAAEALQEHLASVDLRRATERCATMSDSQGSRLLVETFVSVDPLEALRQLWKASRVGPFNGFAPVIQRSAPAASFEAIRRLALEYRSAVLTGDGVEVLGAALAHSSHGSAVETLCCLRKALESLHEATQPEVEANADPRARSLDFSRDLMIQGAYGQLVSTFPEEASRFF